MLLLLFEEDEEELPLVSCASPVAICVRMCAFWSGVRSMECKDAPHAEHRHSVSDDDDDDDEEEAAASAAEEDEEDTIEPAPALLVVDLAAPPLSFNAACS